MVDEPRFDPLYSEHAIERCAWSVAFAQPLPIKLYSKLADENRKVALQRGFQPVQMQGFTINHQTGEFSASLPPDAPINFVTPDGALQFNMQPNGIAFVSNRYVRWEPFFSQINEWPLKIAEKFINFVSVGALKLEYWDRFVWSGDWENFASEKLIRMDTGFVAGAASRNGGAWHSHCGWFENVPGAARRLVNINVDAIDFVRPSSVGQKPSIGIYTMIQDHFSVPGKDTIELQLSDLRSRSVGIHNDLKGALAAVIYDDMQERISLTGNRS